MECTTAAAPSAKPSSPISRISTASHVSSLRDVSLDELHEHWDRLDLVGRKRARHVLTENERVRRGVEALRFGDLDEFGRLISASHASSRDDFENSSEALNSLVEAAAAAPGFLGGKLSERVGRAARR